MKKVIAISLILLPIFGCGPSRDIAKVVDSPSGKYKIKATINKSKTDPTKYLCIHMTLLDSKGNVLSRLQTGASHIMKWAVGWMNKRDIVVLYSGDIGTYAYKIENNKLKEIKTTPAIISRGNQLKNLKYRP